MINSFVTGSVNLASYVTSNRKILLVVVILGLLGVGILVFPTSIYLYPFWQSKIDYVEFDPFKNEIPGLVVNISAPNWLLPDAEKTYTLTVQITNTTKEELTADLKINKDRPYLEFNNIEALPIRSDLKIPPGETIVRTYNFKVHESSKPKEPVSISFELEQDQKVLSRAIIIPVNYFLIPVIAVIGVTIPILFAILRLAVKLILGI